MARGASIKTIVSPYNFSFVAAGTVYQSKGNDPGKVFTEANRMFWIGQAADREVRASRGKKLAGEILSVSGVVPQA